MQDLGDFKASSTVRFYWNTNAIAGESITRATNGTIRVYKNLTTTERSSSNGITDTEDFDSLTGVHACAIDLSDNTDSGFYAAGNDYFVVLAGATIDGKTINHCLAKFSIENRNPQVDVTKWKGSAPANLVDTDKLSVSVQHKSSSVGLSTQEKADANTEADTALADYDAPTNAEMVARTLAAADYATASALATADSVADSILALLQDGTVGLAALEALVDELESRLTAPRAAALDNLDATVSSRATAADLATVDGVADSILAIVGSGTHGNAALKALIDIIDGIVDAIVADTGELQTDWANGGRLDLLIDAIKAKSDLLPASPAATGDIPTAAQNAAGLLDLADGVESGETVRQTLRLQRAALVGKSSGFPGGPVKFRDKGDTKDRITGTVDADGNRTAVTTDAT